LKYAPSRSGAFASASSNRQAGTWLVLRPDVDHVQGMRRRRNVGEIELRHLRDRLEDVVQLRAEALELVLAELEARQVRNMEEFVRGRLPSGSENPPEMEEAPIGAPSHSESDRFSRSP